MRVVNRTREPKPIIQGLRLVADFLNSAGPEKTKSDWNGFLKRTEAGGLFVAWRSNKKTKRPSLVPSLDLDEAKRIRSMIASDLRYLQFDHEGIRTQEHPFGPLLLRLNESPESASYTCVPLGSGKPKPGQAVLTLHSADGSRSRYVAQFAPYSNPRTIKDSLYAILGRALLSGTLGRLKVCRQCGKYLVAQDLKRKFCRGTSCKDDFNNLRKSREGYWREHRVQSIIKQGSSLQ